MNLKLLPVIASCCILFSACSQAPPKDRILDGWKVDEMSADTIENIIIDCQIRDYVGSKIKSQLLTWQIIEDDDRGLYVECAIICIRLEKDGENRFLLANIFRHPEPIQDLLGPSLRSINHLFYPSKYPIRLPRWQLSFICDAPKQKPCCRAFHHRPSNSDIYVFLRDVEWDYLASDGFRLIDTAVCVKSWTSVSGTAPK